MGIDISEDPEDGGSMSLETHESAHYTTQYLNPEDHNIEK
jgi:hypothetical protein